jgi:hypothetical protein
VVLVLLVPTPTRIVKRQARSATGRAVARAAAKKAKKNGKKEGKKKKASSSTGKCVSGAKRKTSQRVTIAAAANTAAVDADDAEDAGAADGADAGELSATNDKHCNAYEP